MTQIEIREGNITIPPVVMRIIFGLLVVVYIALKIADPKYDILGLVAMVFFALCYNELKRIIPSTLSMVQIHEGSIDFIYLGSQDAKLVINLKRDGDVCVYRSFWSNIVYISSGRNTVRLPWPLSSKNEKEIQMALTKNP